MIQKVTSKDLYWIPITAIKHLPIFQNYFEKNLEL